MTVILKKNRRTKTPETEVLYSEKTDIINIINILLPTTRSALVGSRQTRSCDRNAFFF